MNLTVLQDASERIHYRDPAIPIYVSRGDLKRFSNMSALCHWHEDVELLLPLQGYLTYNIDGEKVTVPEGTAIFVNARHMHYGFSADGTDCDYLCITFRPELLCAGEEVKNRYVLPIVTAPSFKYLLLSPSVPEHRPLLDDVRRIDSLHVQMLPGFELLEISCLFQLWQGIFQLAQDSIAEAVSSDGNVLILKQMLEFIRTQYSERISVDAIAAAGGVCRTKCCQVFRQYLGTTPNDYLNSFRLEKGMELLKSTNLTITEIAGLCGFSGGSYFTELFTKQKGCSPKAYRKS